MTTTITVEFRVEDAEPILREEAFRAARYGAWCDYITRRTVNSPVVRSEGLSSAPSGGLGSTT